jgi:hypothetical protein
MTIEENTDAIHFYEFLLQASFFEDVECHMKYFIPMCSPISIPS